MKTTNVELSPIQIWKDKGIVKANFEFQCGGDQMNDTSLTFFNEAGDEVSCPELEDYIDGEIYNQVEFYVNSDGHYQGESGNVYITLEEDNDEEEGATFIYEKESESEWSETFSEVGYCELTPAEAEFVNKYIHSFVGGEDGARTNFKADCILNDEDGELLESIISKISDFAEGYVFKNAEGEESDWLNYTTDMEEATIDDYIHNENNPSLVINETIAVQISKTFTIYKAE